jgi:hypothetical protein
LTITATYRAPEGDIAVVTTRGVRFFDGQAVELNHGDHSALISKLRGNPHFELAGADEPAALVAKHRGRGVYAIVKGDETIIEGLSKTDADQFNALSDADKAIYVQPSSPAQ